MASRRYRVIWTETAARDLEDIVSYVAKDSTQQATKDLKRIRGKSATLRSFPSRGRVVPELDELDIRNWRELIVSPWRVIHRVEGRLVFVESSWTAVAMRKTSCCSASSDESRTHPILAA